MNINVMRKKQLIAKLMSEYVGEEITEKDIKKLLPAEQLLGLLPVEEEPEKTVYLARTEKHTVVAIDTKRNVEIYIQIH